MVNRKELENNLSLITAFRPDGVLTVDKGIATVSHTDTANVAMVYTQFPIPFADGQYGVDFEKMKSLVSAYKTKEIDVGTTDKFITFRSGNIKNRMQMLNISTLNKIRPKADNPLPCVVEVDTAAVLEVITFIEKITTTSKNEFLAMSFEFDGNNLFVKCLEAEDTDRMFDICTVIAGNGEQFKSLFSFDYIRNCIKTIGQIEPSGKMKISIGNNTPCRIEAINVMYIVANRIDGDV